MFTVEQRGAVRERVLGLAEDDDRVVAGAVVGSFAVDRGDRYSDLDLTFGILDDAVMEEAFWHHRYALRDLGVLDEGT